MSELPADGSVELLPVPVASVELLPVSVELLPVSVASVPWVGSVVVAVGSVVDESAWVSVADAETVVSGSVAVAVTVVSGSVADALAPEEPSLDDEPAPEPSSEPQAMDTHAREKQRMRRAVFTSGGG